MTKSKLVIIIIIAAVTLGIFFAVRYATRDNNSANVSAAAALNRAIAESAKTDADLDGISDQDEATLGTNPGLADTDGDGLSDPTESLYKTNPLKKDTFNLGVSDGEAVADGKITMGRGLTK